MNFLDFFFVFVLIGIYTLYIIHCTSCYLVAMLQVLREWLICVLLQAAGARCWLKN